MEKVFSRDYIDFRLRLSQPTCTRSEGELRDIWYMVFIPNRTIPDETGRPVPTGDPPEAYRISENQMTLAEAIRIVRSEEIYFRLWEECKRKFPDCIYQWHPEIRVERDTSDDASLAESADGIFRNVQAGASEEFTPGYNVQVAINQAISELVNNDKPEQVEEQKQETKPVKEKTTAKKEGEKRKRRKIDLKEAMMVWEMRRQGMTQEEIAKELHRDVSNFRKNKYYLAVEENFRKESDYNKMNGILMSVSGAFTHGELNAENSRGYYDYDSNDEDDNWN